MVRENISFSGSVSGGVGPYSYSWDFADGTVRSLTGAATSVSGGALRATSNPTHSYGTTGARLVQLSVRDSAGNVGYASVSVLVRENDDYDGD